MQSNTSYLESSWNLFFVLSTIFRNLHRRIQNPFKHPRWIVVRKSLTVLRWFGRALNTPLFNVTDSHVWLLYKLYAYSTRRYGLLSFISFPCNMTKNFSSKRTYYWNPGLYLHFSNNHLYYLLIDMWRRLFTLHSLINTLDQKSWDIAKTLQHFYVRYFEYDWPCLPKLIASTCRKVW